MLYKTLIVSIEKEAKGRLIDYMEGRSFNKLSCLLMDVSEALSEAWIETDGIISEHRKERDELDQRLEEMQDKIEVLKKDRDDYKRAWTETTRDFTNAMMKLEMVQTKLDGLRPATPDTRPPDSESEEGEGETDSQEAPTTSYPPLKRRNACLGVETETESDPKGK